MSTLLANRNYRLLLSASAVSNLGDGVSALAFPWLTTLITRDPALIALVAAATRLPWLLFAVPAGVLTDRVDRRTLMVQADVLRLVLMAGVIALIVSIPTFPLTHDAEVYVAALAGLAFLLGCAEVVRDNAAQTALPSVVEKADLERANGRIWSIERIMGAFVGPPLAGVLIALAVPAPFALDAATFGLAAWLIWCIAMPPRLAPSRRSLRAEAAEGLAWMLAHRIILRLAVMLGLLNALSAMAVTVLVLFAQDVLGLSSLGYGALLTAGAAGGVLGGLVCPRIALRLGNERSLRLALLLLPTPFLAMSVSSDAAVVAAALFVEMLAGLLWNVVTVSYRQRMIPDAILGRVNSVYRLLGWGMMPVGALAGGWIVALLEPELGRELALRAPYAIAGVGAIGLWLYGRCALRL